MIDAIQHDFETRFGDPSGNNMHIEVAYSYDRAPAEEFVKEVKEKWPGCTATANELPLSICCHIGPGALALAVSMNYPKQA